MNEFVVPELVIWILDEFDEGDEQAPGMRSVHNQSFQQHSGVT